MAFDTYFRITSYGVVATAFAALALTGELDLPSLLLYSMALAFSLYTDWKGLTHLRLRQWMWRALVIGYIPFVFIDAALTNRMLALVHMTLFLSAVKLFQDKRDRDWVFLYLIAFFQMLLAAGLTFDSVFVASLGLFIFFFVSTLAAFEIKISRREVKAVEDEILPSLKKGRAGGRRGNPLAGRVRYLVGASLGQVFFVAVLTVPFFFMIPRFGGGVGRGFADTHALTGFSETVQLGQVAKIKESQRVVMRIRLGSKPTRFIRWRGVALEHYSGDTWTIKKDEHRRTAHTQDRSLYGLGGSQREPFDRDHLLAAPSEPGRLLEQRIALERSGSGALFAAYRPVRLRGPLHRVMQDIHTGAVTTDPIRGRLQYTVWSEISVPSEEKLLADQTEYSDTFNLQLPGDHEGEIKLDPRIRQLAHTITREKRTPYEKARAIEAYLKTQYAYTLDLNYTKRDPLAEFLFDARAGHCEYFATAMVVMLRTLGVPARIVNGFQMGDYNDVNDLYTVRANDAHSWVEVYFAGNKAWVEFDPTPPAGLNDYSAGGLLWRLKKYLEAAEVFWLDYVVTLDSEEQTSIMVDMQARLVAIKDHILSYYYAARAWARGAAASVLDREWNVGDLLKLMGLLAVTTLLAGAVYILSSYLRLRRREPTGYGPWWRRLFVLPRWRTRLAARDPRTSAVLFYEQMLAIAARAGLVKRPDQTPLEFARESGLAEIREITSLYNEVRFGGRGLDESGSRRVSDLLEDLKQRIH